MPALIKILLYALLFLIPILLIRRIKHNRIIRRHTIAKLRLTPEQRTELGHDFPLYLTLPQDLQQELEGLIHVFISEKAFEPCGGLDEITPHMQHVIAAQACLLLLRKPHDLYAKLRTIRLYPEAYIATGDYGEESVRLGESWTTGSVVLAWSSVLSGGRNSEDGHNVTIHEFSHQLDQQDGAGDGVPLLETRSCYREWATIMKPEFDTLISRSSENKRTVLDSYGATNPAEFFAVATETFYEKPHQLQQKHPKLYTLLTNYYGVNPLDWQ
ncbi:MAG: zinc-dependent peptidase [Akkermansiaceae bacterium]